MDFGTPLNWERLLVGMAGALIKKIMNRQERTGNHWTTEMPREYGYYWLAISREENPGLLEEAYKPDLIQIRYNRRFSERRQIVFLEDGQAFTLEEFAEFQHRPYFSKVECPPLPL